MTPRLKEVRENQSITQEKEGGRTSKSNDEVEREEHKTFHIIRLAVPVHKK